MATILDALTTPQALAELALVSPYRTYHDLEVATRDLFRRHYLSLPSDYTYRDFLEWAFQNQQITKTPAGFAVLDTLSACPYCAGAPECFETGAHDPMASCPQCDAWAASLVAPHLECEASVLAYTRSEAY
jgi:hypothetical protein